MSKRIFVLGAGFSKAAGCPLVREFTNKKLLDLVRSRLSSSAEKSKLKRIVNYVESRIQDGYCSNIEDVFNHVAVARYLNVGATEAVEPLPRRYWAKDIFTDLQWFIVKVLQSVTKRKLPREYSTFMKTVRHGDMLITFNYDLVAEQALREHGERFEYALTEEPTADRRTLLKLHGSVNWAVCQKCGPLAEYDRYVAVDAYADEVKCPSCGEYAKSILVPPILFKDPFYSEAGDWLRRLWTKAHEALATASRVVFVGFSMSESDVYARELFKVSSNMNQNKELEYWIINPSQDRALRRRYEDVLIGEQVYLRRHDFVAYVRKFC